MVAIPKYAGITLSKNYFYLFGGQGDIPTPVLALTILIPSKLSNPAFPLPEMKMSNVQLMVASFPHVCISAQYFLDVI